MPWMLGKLKAIIVGSNSPLWLSDVSIVCTFSAESYQFGYPCAFVRLEAYRLQTGISWFDAKAGIIRSAMRMYLAHPTITLGSAA
jgi:hypothetical protein